MNRSTASTGYSLSFGSSSGSTFGSSSGSGTGYNSGYKTCTGSSCDSCSISPSIYSKVIIPKTTTEEKENRIHQLQEQLRESNMALFIMIGGGKQRGKNAMQQMKKYAPDSQDECNICRISHTIHQIIWPWTRYFRSSGQFLGNTHKACASSNDKVGNPRWSDTRRILENTHKGCNKLKVLLPKGFNEKESF